jgi:hypothetical protein
MREHRTFAFAKQAASPREVSAIFEDYQGTSDEDRTQ